MSDAIERRGFFRRLVAAGAAITERPAAKNRRAHHKFQKLYHGPLLIPENVAAIIAEHPAIKKTTCRHLVSRYSFGGVTWLFRCQVPESRAMVGEITRTPEGNIRVHCWSAANPGRYRTPEELLARREQDTQVAEAMATCQSSQIRNERQVEEYNGDYSEYLDPAYAERLMREGGRV